MQYQLHHMLNVQYYRPQNLNEYLTSYTVIRCKLYTHLPNEFSAMNNLLNRNWSCHLMFAILKVEYDGWKCRQNFRPRLLSLEVLLCQQSYASRSSLDYLFVLS